MHAYTVAPAFAINLWVRLVDCVSLCRCVDACDIWTLVTHGRPLCALLLIQTSRVPICVSINKARLQRHAVLVCATAFAGPHMRHLWADVLELQSDQHANVPWPWDELHAGNICTWDLVRLPDPGVSERVVRCEALCVYDLESLSQASRH